MKELVDECRNNSTDLVLVGFAFVRFFLHRLVLGCGVEVFFRNHLFLQNGRISTITDYIGVNAMSSTDTCKR